MDTSRVVTASFTGILDSTELVSLSIISLVPTAIGIYIGNKIRKKISSRTTEYLVYTTLLALSINILI